MSRRRYETLKRSSMSKGATFNEIVDRIDMHDLVEAELRSACYRLMERKGFTPNGIDNIMAGLQAKCKGDLGKGYEIIKFIIDPMPDWDGVTERGNRPRSLPVSFRAEDYASPVLQSAVSQPNERYGCGIIRQALVQVT